jgi:hypothetical protein
MEAARRRRVCSAAQWIKKILPPPRLVCPSEANLNVFVRQLDPALVLKTARELGATHEDLSVPSPNRCPSPSGARIIRKNGP